MIEIRHFDSLGAAKFGWLNAHHHFSFGDIDTRIHDTMGIKYRHVNLVRLANRGVFRVIINPALFGDITVFNTV